MSSVLPAVRSVRLRVLALCIALLPSGLAACGTGDGTDSLDPRSNPAQTCQPDETSSPTLKSAYLRLFTAGDDKRSTSQVGAWIAPGEGAAPLGNPHWLVALGDEYLNYSAAGPYLAKPQEGDASITRAQMASNGRVVIQLLDKSLGAPLSEVDTWRFGWRVLMLWSDGSTTLLQGPAGAWTGRDRALVLRGGQQRAYDYCASLGSERDWDRAKFIPADSDRSTPRAQFFEGFHYGADKLDKDAPDGGVTARVDLRSLGRQCGPLDSPEYPVPGCSSTWENAISSVDTSGGGQRSANAVLTRGDTGECLFIVRNTVVWNLRDIVVERPDGVLATEDWDDATRWIDVSASSRAAEEFRSCSRFIRSQGAF